jgi:two-component system, cell cycle sensor histidine kinase PleC
MQRFGETVDLEDPITSALRLIAPRALAGVAQFLAQLPPTLPYLHADCRAIRHILLTSCAIAGKFSPQDRHGGPFEAGRTSRLRSGDWHVASRVEIALSRFGHVATVHTRAHDGSGLRLTLVKSLATLHGPAFSIESPQRRRPRMCLLFAHARSRLR